MSHTPRGPVPPGPERGGVPRGAPPFFVRGRLSLAQVGGMVLVGMGLVALDGRVLRRLWQAA
ncbi:hypothetical protein [Roseomonas gilardii]|uniref:hypothetical protein n=1 Tax=Roseomonas gilardii TaxID=257708 RepID=UPI000E00707D|nr:hypothetical protein [Roseomonas gilardii]SUE62884.1 Uncharacterised protein [Roseomonas gilardii subsp. rosea]